MPQRQQRRTNAGERPATLRHAAIEAAPFGTGEGAEQIPRLAVPPAADLDAENDEPAPPCRKQLRVSRLPFSPRRLHKHSPSLSGTAAPGLAVPPEMPHGQRRRQDLASETGTSTFISATRTCMATRPPHSRHAQSPAPPVQPWSIARRTSGRQRHGHPKHRRRARSGRRAQMRGRHAQAAEEDYAEQLAREPELCGRGQNMRGSPRLRPRLRQQGLKTACRWPGPAQPRPRVRLAKPGSSVSAVGRTRQPAAANAQRARRSAPSAGRQEAGGPGCSMRRKALAMRRTQRRRILMPQSCPSMGSGLLTPSAAWQCSAVFPACPVLVPVPLSCGSFTRRPLGLYGMMLEVGRTRSTRQKAVNKATRSCQHSMHWVSTRPWQNSSATFAQGSSRLPTSMTFMSSSPQPGPVWFSTYRPSTCFFFLRARPFFRSGCNVFQGISGGASGHGRSLPLFLRRPAPLVQAGTLHRTRLRAANGSPPSASTSLTKGGGPSTPAAEWAGKAKRLAAYARLAPAAKKEDQRRAKAADTAPRTRGGTLLARARASRCTKFTVCGLKRPPTSSARTTSLQRESGRRSSGYVRSLARRAWRRAAPSGMRASKSTSAKQGGTPPGSSRQASECIRELGSTDAPVWVGDPALPPEQQGLVALGVPCGHPAHVAAQLQATRAKQDSLLQGIRSLPDLQSAWFPCPCPPAPVGVVALLTLLATTVQRAPGLVHSGVEAARSSVQQPACAASLVRDLNVAVSRFDDRRVEVIANGLPLWNGAQLAVDATIVSPLASWQRPLPPGCDRCRGQRPPLFCASVGVPESEPPRRPFALPFEVLMSTDGLACCALQLRSPSADSLTSLPEQP